LPPGTNRAFSTVTNSSRNTSACRQAVSMVLKSGSAG
jgi:hypothetical protein